MAAPIRLRDDVDGPSLRGLAKRARDPVPIKPCQHRPLPPRHRAAADAGAVFDIHSKGSGEGVVAPKG